LIEKRGKKPFIKERERVGKGKRSKVLFEKNKIK